MSHIDIRPVTPSRWEDLVALFGPSGAYSGCWCMWFRQSAADFSAKAGAPNRRALKTLVDGRKVPGLLAYVDSTPAGWISVAPRAQFTRVERSPISKPIDDEPAWSIVCLFIAKAFRNQGLGHALVHGAVDFARREGARVIEAYPIDLEHKSRVVPAAELYVGTLALFEKAGFEVVERRKEARPIVRLYV